MAVTSRSGPVKGLTRVAAVRAYRKGAEARQGGKDAAACPHRPDGDLRQRFLARYWLRGYNTTGGEG